MKCELCHERDAETVYMRPRPGQPPEELYVCRACAKREEAFSAKHGVQIAAMETPAPEENKANKSPPDAQNCLNLLDEIGEFIGSIAEDLEEKARQTKEGKCPMCGFSQDDIQKHGLAGCPECYDAFAPVVKSLLEESQGTAVYGGDPLPGVAREKALRELRQALDAAIGREDYIEAKALKARLDALLGGKDGDGAP